MSKDYDYGFKGNGIQVINEPISTKQIYLNLIRTSSHEILLVFPTINAVRREEKIGVLDELIRAASRGVKIRMLSPEDDFVKNRLAKLKDNNVSVQKIETPSETKFKLLIVDKRLVLVVETKDDSKSEFTDAIGLATLSNSKASVQPYVAIFESFWIETQLYEKAREAERLKDEFINIAAHELRNPLMPIIASIENLRDDMEELLMSTPQVKGGRIKESLDSSLGIILRNSVKLLQLSEDILQVSKIESGTFKLNMEPVSMESLTEQVIADIKKKYTGQKSGIHYTFVSKIGQDRYNGSIFCDRSKITQTLFNLLDNAAKFTTSGTIEVTASYRADEIMMEVKDSGTGIDPSIKDRLFEKFASRAEKGTGLGLYIARRIVEAHGGRIWASNNKDGKGATFSFTLPIIIRTEGTEFNHTQTGPFDKGRSLLV
ncbi:MAG TPA: ATP-binding protein [Candidatus Nitrosotalea sp.]|nr:ATP-binding protein [Candidatus Nitrosotalea sp.]